MADESRNSSFSRDVTSVLFVQMVVKCKWQSKLFTSKYLHVHEVTLEVVYDHVGKCRKLALCYFIQINLILFCLTTIWKWNFKQKVTWLKPKNPKRSITENYGLWSLSTGFLSCAVFIMDSIQLGLQFWGCHVNMCVTVLSLKSHGTPAARNQ